MIVLDVSGSTKYPSGIDVDEDGELGETRTALMKALPDVANTDPDDSVLAAEVQAANALLNELDPRRVRVGLVSFSGEVDPSTGRRKSEQQLDAHLEQPLTRDFDAVRRALEAVQLRGSSGGTNMEAGVKLATRELAGLPGAQSASNPHAKGVILLLTDGKPSLPYGLANQEDQQDIEAVIDAGRLAKTAGRAPSAEATPDTGAMSVRPRTTLSGSGFATLTRTSYSSAAAVPGSAIHPSRHTRSAAAAANVRCAPEQSSFMRAESTPRGGYAALRRRYCVCSPLMTSS
jgi:hypothetical protein